jgi:hypothetical protein
MKKLSDKELKNVCKEIVADYESKSLEEVNGLIKVSQINFSKDYNGNKLQVDLEISKINEKQFQVLIFIDDNSGSKSFVSYSYSDTISF